VAAFENFLLYQIGAVSAVFDIAVCWRISTSGNSILFRPLLIFLFLTCYTKRLLPMCHLLLCICVVGGRLDVLSFNVTNQLYSNMYDFCQNFEIYIADVSGYLPGSEVEQIHGR